VVIPRQESRNERVYRRAQNGEVGNVTKANMPESTGRGCPDRAGCQADPVAGPASGRVSGVIAAISLLSSALPGVLPVHGAVQRLCCPHQM